MVLSMDSSLTWSLACLDAAAMTRSTGAVDRRGRGNIRKRGNSLQVRVYSGIDPVTGKELYLSETIRGTDTAARRRAEKALTRLQAQVDQQRAPSTSVSFSYAIDEWLRSADIEPTTRHGYVGYIAQHPSGAR